MRGATVSGKYGAPCKVKSHQSPKLGSRLSRGVAHVEGAGQRTAMQKLRIVTVGISGGRALTRPFRDARRFPSYTMVPRTEGYVYDVGVCPSFKDPSLSRRAKPCSYDSQLLHR